MSDEQVNKIFGRRLRQQREKMNISRKEFASTLGVSPASISMYETGDRLPALPMLINIARALHTSIDNLVGYEVEPLPEYERYKRYLEGLGYSVKEGNIKTGSNDGVTVYTENPYKTTAGKIENPNVPKGSERVYFSSRSNFLVLMRYVENSVLSSREKLFAENTSQALHNFCFTLSFSNEELALNTMSVYPVFSLSSVTKGIIGLSDDKKNALLNYASKLLNEYHGNNSPSHSDNSAATIDTSKGIDVLKKETYLMGFIYGTVMMENILKNAARDADAAPSHGGARDLHVEGDGGGGEDDRKE